MIDDKTKYDLLKAADNFNTMFPNSAITFPEMLERFSKSSFADKDNYLAPIYSEKAYKDFMQFAKDEIQQERAKAWTPQQTQQSRNTERRKQLRGGSPFSER